MSTDVESGNTQTPAAPVTPADAQPAPAATQTPAAETPAATTAETKPADTKPAAVEYQPFKVPTDVKVADSVLGKFTEIAKASNLSQEAAQSLIDGLSPLIAKDSLEAFQAQLVEARKGWQEALKVDKELGGEKSAENVAVAKQAFEKFGTPALKELLETSGLGDHPEVIRWAYNVAKATGEDKVIVGGLSTGSNDQAAASVLYDAKKN